MLPLPKPTRPPKPPDTKKLYPESDTLKLPPPPEQPKPVDQREITYALAKRHNKTGHPRVLGPVGVTQIPLYFCDRAKEIATKLLQHKSRYGKARRYFDSCDFYDRDDPDTLRRQAGYHSFYSDYAATLAKAEACLKHNPKDYKAMVLKADTLFRMCRFEEALLIYSTGLNLKYPYKRIFEDGYYRTTALLYNITGGSFPMFHGGNVRLFHRLVRGQERDLRMFNDTFKHYDELYPLEPNLEGQQRQINMFHVTKPAPSDHVERRVKKAAIQQLICGKKILGGFWDHKMEVETHLIKKHHTLPRFGKANCGEKIEKALNYLHSRINQFEVEAAFLRNHALRNYDKQKDYLIEYGKWMRQPKKKAIVPQAANLNALRYRWACSSLFDVHDKPLDICWVRKTVKRSNSGKSSRIFSRRRPWRCIVADKSSKVGAISFMKCNGNKWPFLGKLYKNVLSRIAQAATPETNTQVCDDPQSVAENAEAIDTNLTPQNADRLYYDPEEEALQYDANRELMKAMKAHADEASTAMSTADPRQGLPQKLLEVLQARIDDAPDTWDLRRKASGDLRENLQRARLVKAAFNQPQHRTGALKGKAGTKGKDQRKSDVEAVDSSDDAPKPADAKASEQTPAETDADSGEAELTVKQEPKKERVSRRPGDRPKLGILEGSVDKLIQNIQREQKRIDKSRLIVVKEEPPAVVVHEKTAEELEAERLLQAKADDPVEIARREFDNQKAALLEKAFSVLMTCTKGSEFLELEMEISELLEQEFPPQTMRFPNGEPISLPGYPPPAEEFVKRTPETLGVNIKKKKKKTDGKQRPATTAEAEKEAAAMKALLEEKGRRASMRSRND